MINPPKHQEEYADRPLDCQEAMEPGFQAIIDCMLEVGWTRGETLRALKRLVAADRGPRKRTPGRKRNSQSREP